MVSFLARHPKRSPRIGTGKPVVLRIIASLALFIVIAIWNGKDSIGQTRAVHYAQADEREALSP
jgi:hypothetical protein